MASNEQVSKKNFFEVSKFLAVKIPILDHCANPPFLGFFLTDIDDQILLKNNVKLVEIYEKRTVLHEETIKYTRYTRDIQVISIRVSSE